MANAIEEEFLTATTNSIRHSIRDIDDSYNNFWDIFAELSQNAVDAIGKDSSDGRIEIDVDCRKRNIKFKDNGCGIAADKLPGLLNLFSSGKADDYDTIGEKGVGLKFVLFQSSRFVITTSDGESAIRATVVDANTWKRQTSNDMIKLQREDIPLPDNPGTTVEVYGVEPAEDEDVFALSIDQFVFMLRTKTALGSTEPIWNSSYEEIEITLHFVDRNGSEFTRRIENRYFLPTELVKGSSIRTVEEFSQWNTADKDDTQKRNYLRDKILVKHEDNLDHNGRKLRYWSCFVPSRGVWNTLSENAGLGTKEQIADDAYRNKWHDLLFQAQITAATKGMPTSIVVAPPPVGNAGCLPDFFVIFEDNSLRFDIGRKSFRGKTSNIYKEEAKVGIALDFVKNFLAVK